MPSTDLADRELLHQFSAGQAEAFAELVRRHLNLVYSIALRQLKDQHQAEDASQIVFALLARRAGELKDGVVIPGWLMQTTRFVCFDLSRTRASQTRLEQHAARSKTMIAESPDNFTSDQSILSQQLDEALGKIKDVDRDAIVLRYFCNESATRIGAMLGMTEAATAKRLSRAMTQLRRLMISSGAGAIGEPTIVSLLSRTVLQAPPGLIERASTPASTIASRAADLARRMPGRSISAKGMIAMAVSTKLKVAAVVVLIGIAGLGIGTVVYHWTHEDVPQNVSVAAASNAPVVVDLRTPQSAFHSVVSAVNGADAAALMRCLYASTKDERALNKAWTDATINNIRLNNALVPRFGEAALHQDSTGPLWPSAQPLPGPDASLAIEPTHDPDAVLVGGQQIGWGRFVRTNSEWKLDVAMHYVTPRGPISGYTGLLVGQANRCNEMLGDLGAEKFHTLAQAQAERVAFGCVGGLIFLNHTEFESRSDNQPPTTGQ